MAVNESGNTICTICHQHLKPPDEAIQAISICGHVFHDLCLKQWSDHCIKKTTGATCPVCKQKFSRENTNRLYLSTSIITELEDIKEQLRQCKEEATREMRLKSRVLQEKKLCETLLEIRSQDLVQAESDCFMLQQSRKSSSQSQALGVTRGMSQNFTSRNRDDIAYLEAVMNKFQDKSEKYDEFIQVLKDFKAKKMKIPDVKSKVMDLLKGHGEALILGFNTFLPIGDQITLDLIMEDLPRRKKTRCTEFVDAINFVNKVKENCEDHVFRSFLDILNLYRANSTTSIAEVHQKIADAFQHHPNLVVEFKYFLPS
ncbi:hypothetical protein MKX03_022605 [Papaver bracteatum]|nr:hypothetical protein MKX03_022605 [Papaver bracteatum]